jgi:hypothetical protein
VNTFQVVLATDGIRTFVTFLYEEIQWSGDFGLSTTIGFNAGDGFRSFTLPDSLTADGILNLDSTSNVGVPGVYMFRVDTVEVIEPGSPVPDPGSG